MAQSNFPIMISVDWLTLSLNSFKLLDNPSNNDTFVWEPRKYGTKQFKAMYDLFYVDTDGALEPFGVFGCLPTLESWAPTICSLKLDNHLLYRDNRGYWLNLLRQFLNDYWLVIRNISRCDIAGDFLYLKDRVSGPQLCKKIKSFEWWKCGSVNISEHYTMPYTLAWEKIVSQDGYDTKTFKQQGAVDVRVETLTFGTMSSDAQVCIYDKTLELMRSEVEFEENGHTRRESSKEYIRDCHKAAGVYDPKRHTWRIEIRLRNKALFVTDADAHCQRSIELDDLSEARLADTFLAAADRYLRLVDASKGGTQPITADYLSRMNGHKNRLPQVMLFSGSKAVLAFAKKPYHEAANRYHRAVINRLDKLGDTLRRVPAHYSTPADTDTIASLIDRLEPIAKAMQKERQELIKARSALTTIKVLLDQNSSWASPEDLKLVQDVEEVLLRHYGTESPIFCRNMISTLQNYSLRLSREINGSSSRPLRRVQAAKPDDSMILLEAADVLKGVFVTAVADQRRADQRSIYYKKFEEGISLFNCCDDVPASILDMLYTMVWSKKYISDIDLKKIVTENYYTNFGLLVRCNFDMHVYAQLAHKRGWSNLWVPPLLSRFQYRDDIPIEHYTPNIQSYNF